MSDPTETDAAPPARERLTAAMDRLLAGTSEYRSLTFVSLAKEAGVGRATLNRMPDVKAAWEARLADAEEGRGATGNPTLRVRQLERQLREARERIRALEEEQRTMARQYQHAVLQLERARSAEAARDGVLPLDPGRRAGRPGGPAT